MQVTINELKTPGEEVKDNQFSMKFLRCLLKRFDTLITVLVKTTLHELTPNQVFAEVMTNDAYRDDHEKEEWVNKNKKKEEDKIDEKKKKSVAFKTTVIQGQGKERSIK
jgi:hypothetical protein